MANEEKELSFEQAFTQLENLVERMEQGKQSLEESLIDFEQGVKLMKRCHDVLRAAEQQIEVLQRDSEGVITSVPLDPTDNQ